MNQTATKRGMVYLTKSDFIAARACATKLFYRKERYPSRSNEDEYLKFLSEGGYVVETVAKLLEPEGVEVGCDDLPEACFGRTMEALASAENITLFEATLIAGNKLARIDILKKTGSVLKLIEVKSKSIDSTKSADPFRGKRGNIKPDWEPYLADVAFQVFVAEELFPSAVVEPALCLVDKARRATNDSIFSSFELSPAPSGSRSRPTVRYTGNVDALRKDHFLTTVGVRAEVDDLLPQVKADAERFAQSLITGPDKLTPSIGVHCRDCEYRFAGNDSGDQRDGFGECWGVLATASPHVLDYFHASTIGGRLTPLVDKLVQSGRAQLGDVEPSDLAKKSGESGPIARRQQIQREYTLAHKEYFGAGLAALLEGHQYPLHFIDFETSRVAVPYAAEMHPYEQVAFQWSCHSQKAPDAAWEHHDWINAEDAFPNVAFARSLMTHIGSTGTVYTWSHHERTTLSDVLRQMTEYGVYDPLLRCWLEDITSGRSVDLVDLCAVARDFYFHPEMKGKLSVKYVLPAVWRSNATLRSHPLFARYLHRAPDGTLLNPYDTLPPLPFGNDDEGQEEVVANGTGAMRAYQDMRYGLSRYEPARKAQWKQLLRQYCELDTAAMLLIWMHWRQNAPSTSAKPQGDQ